MKSYSMRSVLPIRFAKTGCIAASAALCLFGMLLMLHVSVTEEILQTWLGAALLAFGALRLIGYYAKDLYRLAFQYDRELGVLLMLLGAAVLIRSTCRLHFLLFAPGVFLIADSLFRVRIAFDARAFGLHTWWLLLLCAAAAALVGLRMVFAQTGSPAAATGILGAALLAEGLLNLCVTLTTVIIVAHQHSDLVDLYEAEV